MNPIKRQALYVLASTNYTLDREKGVDDILLAVQGHYNPVKVFMAPADYGKPLKGSCNGKRCRYTVELERDDESVNIFNVNDDGHDYRFIIYKDKKNAPWHMQYDRIPFRDYMTIEDLLMDKK